VAGEAGRACLQMLSNWALFALKSNALHDAVAAASAALRLAPYDKASLRLAKALALLGQPDLAELALAGVPEKEGQDIRDAVEKYRALRRLPELRLGTVVPGSDTLPDGCWGVELFDTGTARGRGLRTTRTVEPGEVLIIQTPLLATAAAPASDASQRRIVEDGRVWQGPRAELFAVAVQRAGADPVVRGMLGRMSDGKSAPPVEPLEAFLHSLDSALPPLIPVFMAQGSAVATVDKDRVGRVLRTNWFMGAAQSQEALAALEQHKEASDEEWARMAKELEGGERITKSTALLPAAALINHSTQANCHWGFPWPGSEIAVIFAVAALEAGQELTLTYRPELGEDAEEWAK